MTDEVAQDSPIPLSERIPHPGRHAITLRIETADRRPILEHATHLGLEDSTASISEGKARIRNEAGFAQVDYPGDHEGEAHLLVQYRDGLYVDHRVIPVENDYRRRRRAAINDYLALANHHVVAEHHGPKALRGYGWPVCTGCDSGCHCEHAQWPCSTAVMIAESVGIEHLSRTYSGAIMMQDGLAAYGLTPPE